MNKVEFSRTAKVPFQKRYGNFIGGQWVEPRSGKYFENFSPVFRTWRDVRPESVMRSKADFDNPRLGDSHPPTCSRVKLNRGGSMASTSRPKGSCNFNRGCALVLGTGCTLRHWSGITVPFLAATGDWEFCAPA
jgi:hypothetical protein